MSSETPGPCFAFLDLRQFHSGYVLVVPRAQVADVREADDATTAALMASWPASPAR